MDSGITFSFNNSPIPAMLPKTPEASMGRKILVALDGSEYADRALDLALDFAAKYSAEIVLLSVIDCIHTPIVAERVGVLQPLDWEQYLENLKAFHEQILFRAMNKVKEDKPLLKVTKELAEGRPTDEIIRAVRHRGIDMIFMGSHGLGGIKEFFLGSVSDRIANEAPCPVLIVR